MAKRLAKKLKEQAKVQTTKDKSDIGEEAKLLKFEHHYSNEESDKSSSASSDSEYESDAEIDQLINHKKEEDLKKKMTELSLEDETFLKYPLVGETFFKVWPQTDDYDHVPENYKETLQVFLNKVLPQVYEHNIKRGDKRNRIFQFQHLFIKEQDHKREINIYDQVHAVVPNLLLPMFVVLWCPRFKTYFYVYPFITVDKDKKRAKRMKEFAIKYKIPQAFIPLPEKLFKTPSQVFSLIYDLCVRTSRAAKVGFMHWDIKWENVVFYENELRLIDVEDSMAFAPGVNEYGREKRHEHTTTQPDVVDHELIENDIRMASWTIGSYEYFEDEEFGYSRRRLKDLFEEVRIQDLMYRYVLRSHTNFEVRTRKPVYTPYGDYLGVLALMPRLMSDHKMFKVLFQYLERIDTKPWLNHTVMGTGAMWKPILQTFIHVGKKFNVQLQLPADM